MVVVVVVVVVVLLLLLIIIIIILIIMIIIIIIIYPLKYGSSPVKYFMTMKCKNKKLMESKKKCISTVYKNLLSLCKTHSQTLAAHSFTR